MAPGLATRSTSGQGSIATLKGKDVVKMLKATVMTLFSMLWTGLGIGLVWLFAWVLNPDLDSGTVTLLGFIYGGLLWAGERDKLDKSWDEEFGK